MTVVPNLDLMNKGLRLYVANNDSSNDTGKIVPNLDLMNKGLRLPAQPERIPAKTNKKVPNLDLMNKGLRQFIGQVHPYYIFCSKPRPDE